MVNINAKVQKRLQDGIKKFQPVLSLAKKKDVNESDTVTIISDIINEVLGYDKYLEITSEYAIKKTFCDLAIKIDGKIKILVECKAIGIELKDDHTKQATDYGSNEGIDWVILTNGQHWKIFKIIFAKPIEKELVYEFDMLQLNHRKPESLELLYYISKEACVKNATSNLEDFRIQKQALSKFSIGQLLLTEPLLEALRKTLRKVSPNIKATTSDLKEILENEVLKREILEDARIEMLRKKINKSLSANLQKNNLKNK